MSVAGGQMQRRVVSAVHHVDAGTSHDEHVNDAAPPFPACPVEGAEAMVVTETRAGECEEQRIWDELWKTLKSDSNIFSRFIHWMVSLSNVSFVSLWDWSEWQRSKCAAGFLSPTPAQQQPASPRGADHPHCSLSFAINSLEFPSTSLCYTCEICQEPYNHGAPDGFATWPVSKGFRVWGWVGTGAG